MTHSVYLAKSVARLAAKYLCKIVLYLAVVLGICNVRLDILKHLLYLNISTAVERSLERAYCCAYRGICICSRRGKNSTRECGVITAAVLCVNYHTKVKKLCFLVGIGL